MVLTNSNGLKCMKVIDVMEEKEEQNEREWQLKRETGCTIKWVVALKRCDLSKNLKK